MPSLAIQLVPASRVIAGVKRGRSATDLIAGVDAELRPAAQALAMHALRRLAAAQWARERLASRAPPPEIDALLLVALALLWPAEDGEAGEVYAPHTVVDQTVEAARAVAPASAGFVNAVLRRFVRERDALVSAALDDPQVRLGHPRWWIERVARDWPAQCDELLRQSRLPPPMTLRVNLRRIDVDAYLARLADAGLRARRVTAGLAGVDAALILERPVPVSALAGFADGWVSVQDAAAQAAAPLLLHGLPRGAGSSVLDACAAPGGKTAHLLEIDPSLELTALDSDAKRLVRVHDNLERLGFASPKVRVVHGDVASAASWWDGKPFDAILLDAPCSASGIVRRHPDIPWLRRPADIEALARTQSRLIDACLRLLAPGGCMVYASCSIFRAEGQAQIDALMQRLGVRAPKLDPASPGHLLPLPENGADAATHDGFFYARVTT
jgi:16S rRNA (cytosine967-C5)-methyltransferase